MLTTLLFILTLIKEHPNWDKICKYNGSLARMSISNNFPSLNSYASDKTKNTDEDQQEEEEDESAFSFSAKKTFDTTKDLNNLASMIAGPRESKETFKVNLFAKFDVFDETGGGDEEDIDDMDKKFEQLTFDCRTSKKSTIDFDIGSIQQTTSLEQDDLLDLMDS